MSDSTTVVGKIEQLTDLTANTGLPSNGGLPGNGGLLGNVKPQQVASIASQVNTRIAQSIPAPILAKLQAQMFNTNELKSVYFHGLIYGGIDSGKTYVAAKFGTPENTRIIMTRSKEQLKTLEGEGYKGIHANTAELFRYAVMYPEALWPDWAKLADRTLVIDDITQAKDMLNDDNEFSDDGKEVKDLRKISKGSKDDLCEMIQLSALRKPMNLIVVALERSWDVGKETRITPDLPPSMANMLNADFEYVFYLKKLSPTNRQLFTDTDREMVVKKDEKGRDISGFQVVTFARHKISQGLVGKVIKPKESPDLRSIWEKVKGATSTGVAK